GVDPAVRDPGEHDRENFEQQHAEHERGCLGRREGTRPDHERPAEGDQSDERGHRDGQGRPAVNSDRGHPGHRFGGHRLRSGPDGWRPAAIWVTVRYGSGARILAIWGANVGEAVSTEAAGPSVTISPSAITTTRSQVLVANSTSWVATTIACPSAASLDRAPVSAALAW